VFAQLAPRLIALVICELRLAGRRSRMLRVAQLGLSATGPELVVELPFKADPLSLQVTRLYDDVGGIRSASLQIAEPRTRRRQRRGPATRSLGGSSVSQRQGSAYSEYTAFDFVQSATLPATLSGRSDEFIAGELGSAGPEAQPHRSLASCVPTSKQWIQRRAIQRPVRHIVVTTGPFPGYENAPIGSKPTLSYRRLFRGFDDSR
jgi:hypothetical protein